MKKRTNTCPYLVLDQRVDVKSLESNDQYSKLPFDTENQVSLVQLVVAKSTLWKYMKDGKRLRVTGELFGAISGHHHTKVLKAKKITSKPKVKLGKVKIYCNSGRMCDAT